MIVPKNRALYRYAVDVFLDLLHQVQERLAAYRCNDLDVKCWNAFVEEFSKRNINFTKGFVRDFCEYGIQNWFNSSINKGDQHRVRFAWVFSRKAIQRWDALKWDARQKYVRARLKKDYSIINDVRPKLNSAFKGVRVIEERFKKEFFNSRRGFFWCIANTTLYNHKSLLCKGCVNKSECKEVLRQNYYKIYKLRGYDK